ncbi:hypothetical protein ACPRNU_20520 [Chromobacterium vaccinii]|uniref:hypothetical protein n=1 Tax=Chromobacterium vaccinii TaxID=1108595 RepID=UPI003C78C5D6
MEFILAIFIALVVVGRLFPPRYRIRIIQTGVDPYHPHPPPSPLPAEPAAVKEGDPITISRDFISTLDGATQAQMFSIIAKDYFRLIEEALQKRKPARARELIESLKKQFPDAKFEGLDVAEAKIRKMEEA